MKGQSLTKMVKLQGTITQECWKHSIYTDRNRTAEILHFQVTGECNTWKKKKSLSHCNTSRGRWNQEWWKITSIRAKPLLKIPYFYPTNLEGHNYALRKTVWKALLKLEQKGFISVFLCMQLWAGIYLTS